MNNEQYDNFFVKTNFKYTKPKIKQFIIIELVLGLIIISYSAAVMLKYPNHEEIKQKVTNKQEVIINENKQQNEQIDNKFENKKENIGKPEVTENKEIIPVNQKETKSNVSANNNQIETNKNKIDNSKIKESKSDFDSVSEYFDWG